MQSLVIPDTCAQFEYTPKKIAPNANHQFIVRETLDSNESLMHGRHEDTEMADRFETILSDLEKTQDSIENIDFTGGVQLKAKDVLLEKNKGTSSTPLSVRKKLQEHGLLDMTNEQDTTNSQVYFFNYS